MKKIHKIVAVMFVLIASISSPSMSATATNVKCSGCVGSSDIKNSTITSGDIKNGTISANDLKSNSVSNSKIRDGAVTRNKLGSDVQVILDTVDTNTTGVTTNTTGVTTNATGVTTNATGITTNTANITSNTNTITTNGTDISSLGTRITQLENGESPSVPVNCVADSTALLSTLISDNTNYVLNGICDGPIEIRGRRNVAILGDGDDGIALPVNEGPAALVISASMDILLNDLVLTVSDFSNVLVVEKNSFVDVGNTNISGGDTGINVNTNATVQIQSGVIVNDFRNNGANVGNGGVLIIFQPTSFIGSSTSINGLTFGLSTFGGGNIFITGLASGTVITPTTSLDGILSTRAVTAGDNGSIIVEGAATINGSVFTGGSANIRISGVVDIIGDVWADGRSSLIIRSASTITGNVQAYSGANISINNSTINSGVAGCCFSVQDNSTVTLDNTTYTVDNPQIGSGGRLNLYNGSSLSFPNNLVISRGAGVVLEDSDITGAGIEISRYGTLTLPGFSGANINLNVTNITCTDAEGYDDGGLTLTTAPVAVNCP
jgi:hypothetical protein